MRLTMHLPGDLQAPLAARRAVSVFHDRLPPEMLENVALVVNELVTNSLLHGCKEGEEIEVEMRCSPRHISGHVQDRGPGFAPPSPGDHDAPSGRGLVLVEELTSAWGVDTNPHTRVWFEVDEEEPGS